MQLVGLLWGRMIYALRSEIHLFGVSLERSIFSLSFPTEQAQVSDISRLCLCSLIAVCVARLRDLKIAAENISFWPNEAQSQTLPHTHCVLNNSFDCSAILYLFLGDTSQLVSKLSLVYHLSLQLPPESVSFSIYFCFSTFC